MNFYRTIKAYTGYLIQTATNAVTIKSVTQTVGDSTANLPNLQGATDTFLLANTAAVVTAKDIDGGTASNQSRLTLPKNTTTNLASLSRKEATFSYDTTLKSVVVDDGTAFKPVGGGLIVTPITAPATSGVVLTAGNHYVIDGLTADTTMTLPSGAASATWRVSVDGNQTSGFRLTLLCAGSDTLHYDGGDHTDARLVYPGDWIEGSWSGSTYWTVDCASRANIAASYSTTTKSTKEIIFAYTTDLTVAFTGGSPTPTLTRGAAIFYADSNNIWRMKFNIEFTFASTAGLTAATITFAKSSLIFANGPVQAIIGNWGSSSVCPRGFVSSNTNIMAIDSSSVTATAARFSGDVELKQQPTDYTTTANMENILYSDIYIPPVVPGVSDGIVSKNGLAGRADGGLPSSGYIGEKVTWVGPPGNQAITTLADWNTTNAAAITLTAGTWLVLANISCYYAPAGASGDRGYLSILITDNSNTIVQGMERILYVGSVSRVSGEVDLCLPFSFVANLSSTTTYKIRAQKVDQQGVGSCSLINTSLSRSEFYGIRIA